ncbi:hypothetical protein C8R45DRAFT_1085163 [Mycena sanguinolenta]|nr:hypothetical protein C8R45DRAFT_1085163 [Mycena sanguinolenta]
MPTEIMSHIFAFILLPHQPNPASAPWTVSAVCARWRAIIISQPCFWTSIRYNDTCSSPSDLAKLETQLRRSGQSSLSVEFVADNWRDLTPQEEEILQLFCKHAGRWETVSLDGPEALFGQLRRSMQGQLTHLRKLTIEIPYEYEVAPLDMFHEAPQLRTVFANRGYWSMATLMELPWPQRLQYGGSNTWDGHLHALGSASNLVDCSLEITVSAQTPYIPIVLPRLRRLSLSDSELVGCLETPALQELYYDIDHDTAVLFFLRRQTVSTTFEAVSTITHLALLFTPPIEFLRDFSSRPTMAPAVEHLTTRFLDMASDEDASGADEFHDRFVEAIQSRSGGPLKSVKVYTTNTDSSQVWNQNAGKADVMVETCLPEARVDNSFQ